MQFGVKIEYCRCYRKWKGKAKWRRSDEGPDSDSISHLSVCILSTDSVAVSSRITRLMLREQLPTHRMAIVSLLIAGIVHAADVSHSVF